MFSLLHLIVYKVLFTIFPEFLCSRISDENSIACTKTCDHSQTYAFASCSCPYNIHNILYALRCGSHIHFSVKNNPAHSLKTCEFLKLLHDEPRIILRNRNRFPFEFRDVFWVITSFTPGVFFRAQPSLSKKAQCRKSKSKIFVRARPLEV